MKLYGIKNCDTVKKARKWLESKDASYDFVDFRVEGVTAAQIAQWVSAAGIDIVLNKRGTTWRKLSDAQKAETNTDKLIALMADEPTLIKRPVIVANDAVHVGFKADVQDALSQLIDG